MNKTEILAVVGEHRHLDAAVYRLAKLALTDEQVTEERKRLKKRDAALKMGFTVVALLGVLAIWSFTLLTDHRWDKNTYPNTLFAALLSGAWAYVSYVVRDIVIFFAANNARREALRPIAGTSRCEELIKCLKNGGPLVAEWRDVAVAERGQLRRYDYEIMDALQSVHAEDVSRAERKARYDAACKELHEVPQASA